MMNGITIGSDPEFFLRDRAGNFVSAIGRVKGTKDNKIDLPGGHKLFYDNVLAEMNISPSTDENGFVHSISDCFHSVAKAISPCFMVQQASMMFPAKECQHPDAKIFGCDPEYCAYDLKQILPPICENTFRSAGGHIHLGAPEGVYPLAAAVLPEGTCEDGLERKSRDWGRVWVIRMLDLFVGLPSILLDQDPTSPERRNLYGKAGTHRPKEEYGVEYRAVGNFWLSSPTMVKLVYNLCMHAVDFVARGLHEELWKDEKTCVAYEVDELRTAINTSNRILTIKLMESVVKRHLPNHLWTQIFEMSEPRPVNFLREWGLS